MILLGMQEEICRRYSGGEKAKELAKEYHIASITIYRTLHRNEIEVRRRSLFSEEQIEWLRENSRNHTIPEMAATLGRNKHGLYNKLKKLNLAYKRHKREVMPVEARP